MAPTLPRIPPKLGAATVFDVERQAGNKHVRGFGQQRLQAFAHFALARPEDCVVVAGHSLWFKSFFDEYLPSDVDHAARRLKIANGGVVACDLSLGLLPNGQTVFAVDPTSVTPLHKGFAAKTAADAPALAGPRPAAAAVAAASPSPRGGRRGREATPSPPLRPVIDDHFGKAKAA